MSVTTPVEFGRYELLEKIGQGGMAEVFKARATGHAGFAKIVVVKRILPERAGDSRFADMFVREAKLCAHLMHPNIVSTFDLGERDGLLYITMEYIQGIDLLGLLKKATAARTRLPPQIALQIALGLAKGLDYAHTARDDRGRAMRIVHRDVSPANVMVGYRGEVKLMDFGVAHANLDGGRRRGAAQLVRTDGLKGTVAYLSPEAASGAAIDHRSDIFALGTLLYEMLTLKRLFVGKTQLATLANVRRAEIEERMERHSFIPSGVGRIIRRALARDPADRYQSAAELEEDVLDFLFEERHRVGPGGLARFVGTLFPKARQVAPAPRAGERSRRLKTRRMTRPDVPLGALVEVPVDTVETEGVPAAKAK